MQLEASQFAPLALARYELRLRARADMVSQALLGSTLRGSFGHAWKTLVCAEAPGERAGCFLRETCRKPDECRYSFFKSAARPTAVNQAGDSSPQATGEVPRPYLFRPPIPPLTREMSDGAVLKIKVTKGGVLPFRLTLLGAGVRELPHIFSAVGLMAKRGLGVGRVPFSLEGVSVLDEDDRPTPVFEPRVSRVAPHADKVKRLDELVEKRLGELHVSDSLTLRLLTPARVRIEGRVQGGLTFATLIGLLSRRVRLLAKFYGSRPVEWDHAALVVCAGRVATGRSNLWHHRAERYSETRQGKIEQGGLLGEITFVGGEVGGLLPLVVAGEFLHVGSGTSFGLGCYRIIT